MRPAAKQGRLEHQAKAQKKAGDKAHVFADCVVGQELIAGKLREKVYGEGKATNQANATPAKNKMNIRNTAARRTFFSFGSMPAAEGDNLVEDQGTGNCQACGETTRIWAIMASGGRI